MNSPTSLLHNAVKGPGLQVLPGRGVLRCSPCNLCLGEIPFPCREGTPCLVDGVMAPVFDSLVVCEVLRSVLRSTDSIPSGTGSGSHPILIRAGGAGNRGGCARLSIRDLSGILER